MVLVNYDQLEQLGYYEYDTNPTAGDRATIERMIQQELRTQMAPGQQQPLHPQVANTLPINTLPLDQIGQENVARFRTEEFERFNEDDEEDSTNIHNDQDINLPHNNNQNPNQNNINNSNNITNNVGNNHNHQNSNHIHEGVPGSTSEILSRATSPRGIDLSRYSEFNQNHDIQYNNLYSTLSSSLMHQRNLELAAQHNGNRRAQQQTQIGILEQFHQDQLKAILNKRERIEELEERKRRQRMTVVPEIDHLEDRWRSGIQSELDKGIERANREQ